MKFLEKEVENSTLSSDKKIFLKNLLKFLFIITSKKYSTLEKVERVVKIDVTTSLRSCQEKNSKINYNNRKAIFHVSQAPEAAIRLPPKIGNKNILNRKVSNRRFKIKKLLL